jgi:hypothetical protein
MSPKRAKPVDRTKLTAEEAGAAMAAHVNAAPRKPRPTAAQINKANREFWGESAPPPAEASTHPGVAPLVAQAHVMTLREVHRETQAKAESTIQSKRAKKPRRKGPTYRSVIIERMRVWHLRGDSFKEFLRSAEGGFKGFSIMPDADKFVIECDVANEPKKPVSLSTLRGWWAEAG